MDEEIRNDETPKEDLEADAADLDDDALATSDTEDDSESF